VSTNAGYVGGGYYNPIDQFVDVARPLVSERLAELLKNPEMSLNAGDKPTYFVADIYAELQHLLLPGELLFAMYDKGNFKVAVYISGEERLMDFEVQVNSDMLRRCGFFAVYRNQADKGLTHEFFPNEIKRANSPHHTSD
jgi:hypothetical protein